MNQAIGSKKLQSGFTLVEILISMAIALIVMGSLILAFTNQSRVFSQQTDLTKSQANARAALYIMSRDIRMAGYSGIPLGWDKAVAANNTYPVLSIKDGATILPNPAFSVAVANSLKTINGNSGAGSPDAIEIVGNFLRVNTGLSVAVAADTSTCTILSGATIFAATGFNKPAYLIIGESGESIIVEVHKIALVDPSSKTITIDSTVPFAYAFGSFATPPQNVMVAPLSRRVYYVAPRQNDDKGNPTPTLFVRNYPDIDNSADFTEMELARGVSNLQFSYDLAAADKISLNNNRACDPCTIRGVNIRLWTWSDKFRNDQPLLREFSTSVRVRNMGFSAANCLLAGC